MGTIRSILDEIAKLRDGALLVIDYENTNRYCLVADEPDGTKTAYYFSAPIYNRQTRKMIDLKFHRGDDGIYYVGSNVTVSFSNQIVMENKAGYCLISLKGPVSFVSDRELHWGKHRFYPTTNGLLLQAACEDGKPFSFELELGTPFLGVRANGKQVSLVKGVFPPFITMSCLGTGDEQGNIIAPAKITYQKHSDRRYSLTVTPCSPAGKWMLLELNLYEEKLILDTTVESADPKTNNAFGTAAFLGTTGEYGEQWLYSRPDFGRMTELMDKRILRVVAHLPKLDKGPVGVSAYEAAGRFCSFGSNWNNKAAVGNFISNGEVRGSYRDLDLTRLMADARTGNLLPFPGIVLKSQNDIGGFCAVSTGDSCFAPQIYEIHYQ
ncbi:MAG: hypothetical protein IJ036_04795 [Lachnospiraceae bacterium]|nr:hypothetical protein [Lachnospiraceae bacterium]